MSVINKFVQMCAQNRGNIHYVERKPLISEEWQAAVSLSQSDMPIF